MKKSHIIFSGETGWEKCFMIVLQCKHQIAPIVKILMK